MKTRTKTSRRNSRQPASKIAADLAADLIPGHSIIYDLRCAHWQIESQSREMAKYSSGETITKLQAQTISFFLAMIADSLEKIREVDPKDWTGKKAKIKSVVEVNAVGRIRCQF